MELFVTLVNRSLKCHKELHVTFCGGTTHALVERCADISTYNNFCFCQTKFSTADNPDTSCEIGFLFRSKNSSEKNNETVKEWKF